MRFFIAGKKFHPYCCIMLKLAIPMPVWRSFTNGYFDPFDIYDNEKGEYGIEKIPHITILYGLHSGIDIVKLKKLLVKIDSIDCRFTSVSAFKNPKYDVLKFDVESPQCVKMHDDIKACFENSEQYNGYVPHATIAYLKKGHSDDYVRDEKFDIPVTVDSYWFNDTARDEYFRK